MPSLFLAPVGFGMLSEFWNLVGLSSRAGPGWGQDSQAGCPSQIPLLNLYCLVCPASVQNPSEFKS